MSDTTSDTTSDPVAARAHWRAADRHYTAAERFRLNNMPEAEQAALAAARDEERIAELLGEGRPR